MHTHIVRQGPLLEFKLYYQAGFEPFLSGPEGLGKKTS
jgi:hypothetical protein